MKRIIYSVLGLSIMAGFAAFIGFQTVLACGFYESCIQPIQTYGPIITTTNTNNNNNVTDNINTNINSNDISITTGFGGGSYNGGTSYDYPQCDDGYDNDNDGWVDYPYDSGCSSYSDDSERSSNDNNDRECNDGRDNDGDGDYDYPEDRGCSSYSDDSEDSEDNNNDRYQCNDGRDNDGDGDYDYPEDAGCSSRTDNSENSDRNNNDAECNDGRDNDHDGDYDYPQDLGCHSYSDDSEDSEDNNNDRYQCNDGRDNDGDGDYDYPEDLGCSSRTDNSENSERNNSRYECSDNRDNDGDGDYDYPDDRGCTSRTDDSEDTDRNNNNGSAPYFTSTPLTTIQAGQIYSYNADAISPSGRTLTYSLAVSPTGMTINSFTGLIQWSVPATIGNSYQAALVVARDSSGNQATQSYIISVTRPIIVNPPIYNPPVNPPVQDLIISNVQAEEVNGNVIVSFRTNLAANGSVRYGQDSEFSKTSNFTYPFNQISDSGRSTTHEVNLGALTPGRAYFMRAFAVSTSDSAFSQEITFTRSGSVAGVGTETRSDSTCSDGIDNDKDGLADAVDPDCQGEAGQANASSGSTFASALESFGAFLISPWFLLLVIIILVIYIIVTRREQEIIHTNGPIEIKS